MRARVVCSIGSLFFLAFFLYALIPLSVSGKEIQQIVVATGSPYELGLGNALGNAFQKETGCTVRWIKTPTGPGLELGKHGLAHVTMGHNREATAKFFEEGYAVKRADLMYNLTIIVGPKNDPAKIAGMTDLKAAHKKIFRAKAPYLSRGDMGGMHIMELKFWKEMNLNPEGQPWYEVSNKFMLASLFSADAKNQYHMLDSSTWAIHKSKVSNLVVLVEGKKNEYEISLVDPVENPNLNYNFGFAQKFFDFCLGEKGREVISTFGEKEYGQAVYYVYPKPSDAPVKQPMEELVH